MTSADAAFMERALFLAERGRGSTSPNPIVGAVVVSRDGIVVGKGAHARAGGPHAEVVALDAAGDRARGATLYCTLEPCSHHGRTGPCAERIVHAGVSRVVAAVRDPNPRVAGAGFAYLEAHGVEVSVGVGAPTALHQNAPFFTWVAERRPFVTIKAAMSVDGFVGRPGERVRLTGLEADRHLHRQRAEIDAIAVGAGTMRADDPLLTARHVYRARPLTRVIFDWRLEVRPDARLFSTLDAGPVIMVVGQEAVRTHPSRAAAVEAAGAEILPFETRAVEPVLAALAGREVVWLLVEGGPRVHRTFLEADKVDRVQWVVSPIRLGTGIPVATAGRGAPAWQMPPRVQALGADVLMEFDVHGSDRSHGQD